LLEVKVRKEKKRRRRRRRELKRAKFIFFGKKFTPVSNIYEP